MLAERIKYIAHWLWVVAKNWIIQILLLLF